MRIRIEGKIIEKAKAFKTNYSHEIYAMILNNLNPDTAKNIHSKEKFYRLFTFTNIYIESQKVHFYISGEDSLVKEFISSILANQLIRIDDMVINIISIQPLPQLTLKDKYNFKSDVIVNIMNNEKTVLSDDVRYMEERLNRNAINKAKLLGYSGNIEIKIKSPKLSVKKYKNGHIRSWKCILEVQGDYNVINTIYNVGCGENTSTGSGFMW